MWLQLQHKLKPEHIVAVVATMPVGRPYNRFKDTRRLVESKRMCRQSGKTRKLTDGNEIVGHDSDSKTLSTLEVNTYRKLAPAFSDYQPSLPAQSRPLFFGKQSFKTAN